MKAIINMYKVNIIEDFKNFSKGLSLMTLSIFTLIQIFIKLNLLTLKLLFQYPDLFAPYNANKNRLFINETSFMTDSKLLNTSRVDQLNSEYIERGIL